MNAHDVFCANPDCPARGRCGEGNIGIDGRTPPRYRCAVCRKTFGARAGTPFYRRSTDETLIALIVTLIAHGCPITAIVAAYGVQRQTVSDWLDAAGSQGEAVHRHLVCQPRDLSAVQADEIRVRQQGRAGALWAAWLALAMVVTTRLWLGGVVSPRRDGALIARLCALVRRVRCPRRLWSALMASPPTSSKCGGWRVRRCHAAARGGGGGTIQTAYIERLNGTFRARLAPLARRTRAGGRTVARCGARDVAGGSGRQHLHAAWQSGTRADAGDGGGDHRSLLERQ